MDLQERSLRALRDRLADAFLDEGEHAGQKWAVVQRERCIEALTLLRDEIGFDVLMDLTAVDWLDKGMPERFCLVYQLYSMAENQYFRVKCWVPEHEPEADTAIGVWKAANWAEREIWDLFGIQFRGHPDLRRLVLPFEYEGHPLRKDYPLIGRGERHSFPRYER